MLFRGKTEKITLEELNPLLELLFERKLGQFTAQMAGESRELQNARSHFISACETFESLNAEPYTEDLYSVNINFVKNQKRIYAETLKRLAESIVLGSKGASNTYEEYLLMVSKIESIMNEMLKANSAFKQVMYCYSNHLGDFKRAFSGLERITEMMKSELNKKAEEFSKYKAVKERVSKLYRGAEELAALKNNVDVVRTSSGLDLGTDSDKNTSELPSAIASKKSELSNLEGEISRMRKKAYSLVSPLEKASKKFDHSSASKRKLHTFVENPFNATQSEASYEEFRMLVKNLGDALNRREIDIRNVEGVSKAVSTILSTDLYSIADSIRLLQEKRAQIANETALLEKDMNLIKEVKESHERRIREIETMEGKAEELERSIGLVKNEIEKWIMDRYGKSVTITI